MDDVQRQRAEFERALCVHQEKRRKEEQMLQEHRITLERAVAERLVRVPARCTPYNVALALSCSDTRSSWSCN